MNIKQTARTAARTSLAERRLDRVGTRTANNWAESAALQWHDQGHGTCAPSLGVRRDSLYPFGHSRSAWAGERWQIRFWKPLACGKARGQVLMVPADKAAARGLCTDRPGVAPFSSGLPVSPAGKIAWPQSDYPSSWGILRKVLPGNVVSDALHCPLRPWECLLRNRPGQERSKRFRGDISVGESPSGPERNS